MSSYSQKLSSDYVRTYRTMLQNLSKPRVLPKDQSSSKVYTPTSTVSTADASSVFFPLFYAGEKGALGIWDKRNGVGAVKRRLDDDDRSYHVLELSNPRTNLGTFICTPRSALNALHITLPHMVMAMKNYRRNFAFDVLIMDSNAYRRRFSFATWYNPSALKKFSFMCQVPLRLEIGWNEIHVDFNELVRSTYRTTYVETIRVQIYANCKLRQIFFCDEKIIKGEIPIPSMRDFSNIRLVPLDFGPRTHPDGIEPGPEKKRNVPYVDPPAQVAPSRLEQDLKSLQRKRFAEVSKQRLILQPYKTYFRELLHEEKQLKKMANAKEKETIAKTEALAKEIRNKSQNEMEDSSMSIVPVDGGVISNIFNKMDIPSFLSEIHDAVTKDKPLPKLPTISEADEKELKVMKVAQTDSKSVKSAEEKANLHNNNVPIKPEVKDDVSPSDSVSTTSSHTEPPLISLKPNEKPGAQNITFTLITPKSKAN